jgi:hypothetical protein
LLRSVSDLVNLPIALATGAALAARLGDPVRAGTLWGAVEAEAERTPRETTTESLAQYEPYVEPVRGDAFEEARKQGRTLSLERHRLCPRRTWMRASSPARTGRLQGPSRNRVPASRRARPYPVETATPPPARSRLDEANPRLGECFGMHPDESMRHARLRRAARHSAYAATSSPASTRPRVVSQPHRKSPTTTQKIAAGTQAQWMRRRLPRRGRTPSIVPGGMAIGWASVRQ